MAITLREDVVYLTRGGGHVGPLSRRNHPVYNWTDGVHNWTESGSYVEGWEIYPLDIISEAVTAPVDCPTSPVRKVTRTEIVPGTYGCVEIRTTGSFTATFRFYGDNHITVLTSSELRSAASIFTELADAFDAMAEEEK